MTSEDIAITSPDNHLRAADVLLRLAAGLDRADKELLASTFTDDAMVDFSPCGRKLGLEFPVVTGREAIVAFLASTGRTQTTSHLVSNARVHASGEAVKLRALVNATHILKRDPQRRFRMTNWYELDIVADGSIGRATRLVIDNVWFTGDPLVLMDRE